MLFGRSRLARTGLGTKTPVVKLIRRVIKALSPDVVMAPARFTPESIPRYVKGKMEGEIDEERVAKSKVKSKLTPEKSRLVPNDDFVIIKDEISRLLVDRTGKTYMLGMDEVLSDLWDGYIQGNYTNKRGMEGDTDVYASMYGAGSYRFLQLLDNTFFIQGLGNRVLWLDEPVTPPLGENFFFANRIDEELDELVEWTVRALRYIKESNVRDVIASNPKYWLEWVNKNYAEFAKEQGSVLGAAEQEYISKMILNTLKLAVCYAAAEFSIQINQQAISVSSEHMKMAVEDGKVFVKMWASLMKKATQVKVEGKSTEQRMGTRTVDLRTVLEVGLRIPLFTMKNVRGDLDVTDKRLVADLVELGETKEFLEEMTDSEEGQATRGKLTEKEWAMFTKKRGPKPQVFRLTAEGLKYLKA